MFKMKYVLVGTVMATILGLTPIIHAESVKLVQWWDEYLPQKREKIAYMGYSRTTISLQSQDVNGDGIYDDALLCREFSITDFFNPPPACLPDSRKADRYRTDRPSGQFYGGIVARLTNVSHITEKNKKGEKLPFFRDTGQATVQPTEGAKPNLYDPDYPHNIRRAGSKDWGLGWADITFTASRKGVDRFNAVEDAEQNASAVFIWKKEDFINGGASTEAITFDNTSKISVDLTRTRRNVEEGRFVVQDGDQLWISDYKYAVSGRPRATVELNPLHSHWAIYTPSGCDIAFNRENATFVDHTFQNIQAVGVYFATYSFTHEVTSFHFDNFQFYAATNDPSPELILAQSLTGKAIDFQGNRVSTNAKFSRGISVNGGTVTVHSSDQMDIRGVITVDSYHIGKEADIIVVAGYKPISTGKELLFMFNKEGNILPWDGNLANLVAYKETDLLRDKNKERFKQNLVLAPQRRVQIFPVTLSAFRDNELDTILLGCEERPSTYSGLLNDVPPGLLKFFFGYRLKDDGTIVYNSESINIRITSN